MALCALALVVLVSLRETDEPKPDRRAEVAAPARLPGQAAPSAAPVASGMSQPAASVSGLVPRFLGLNASHAGRPAGAVEDRWGDAVTVAELDSPAVEDPALHRRVRLVRSGFKYPLVRVEELFRRDPATGADTLLAQVAMVADHVLLKPAPDANEPALLAALTAAGGSIRSRMPASGLWLVTIPAPLDISGLPDALDRFQSLAGVVAYAEPDFVVHATLIPDDTGYAQLYGLHNTGQTGGVADADIDAPEAWEIATGSRAVRVGVIDTGIDYTHPDLAANIWTNPGEIPGNHVDDDGNGYVDDVRGWDFVNEDNDPMDDHYHGTHCAGTIGAVGDNGLGVVGVNWQVSLVALKFLSASGSGTTSDAVEAVAYAKRLGLDLTSNSWGGGGYSQALRDVIAEAGAAGQLFVAAAGNSARDTDASPNYPSGYDLPTIIAVAATDHADQLAYFSNYGVASVDLAAPGVGTYSTAPASLFRTLSGTSMAAPHVAGAVALMRSHRPEATASELKSALLDSVDPLPALAGKVLSGGRLNLHRALLALDDLLITPTTGWSATAPVGGPFPATASTYTLANRADEPRSWSVALDVPWAAADLASGTVPAGGTASITISLDLPAAAALPAGMHTGQVLITDTTTGRVHRRELRLLATPPALFAFDLASDPGWPRTGQWAFGHPAGAGGTTYGHPDPGAGFTGPNAFGVNLTGDYSLTLGGPHTLVAGPFNLTGYVSTRLQFRRWLNSDYEPWVSATVDLSTDGTTWRTLWRNGAALITESAWSLQDIDLSAYADNRPAVYLRWTYSVASSAAWSLSGWNLDDIVILGARLHRLHFAALPPVAESAGGATATLMIEPPSEGPLAISFVSGDATGIPAPAALTVPAGTASVSVPLSILDNTRLDGTRLIGISAEASGYSSEPLTVTVQDDETGALSFELPAGAVEGSPPVAARLTVSPPSDVPITVSLASDLPDAAAVPSTVVLPAGAASVEFAITLPDNVRIEPARVAGLSASVAGWPVARAGLTVADNESRTLTLSFVSGLAEGRGVANEAGTVKLAGTLATPLVVNLASSMPEQLSVPATVEIPAGSFAVKFPVTLADDAALDGVNNVSVTASAEAFADGTVQVPVADNDPASFVFDPIPSPQYVSQAFAGRIVALDINGAVAEGYVGTAALSATRGGQAAPFTPAQTTAFVAGTWSGALKALDFGEDWQVRAASGAIAGVSSTFRVLTPVVQVLDLATNDIVYDPGTERIYASTPAGTLVPIVPTTGVPGTAIPVSTTAATLLARASDGSRIWVAHENSTKIRSLRLPSLTLTDSFAVGYDSFWGNFGTEDIVAMPGAPGTIAVARTKRATTPHAGVVIFDEGIPRPTISSWSSNPSSNSIEAGVTPGRLFGFNNESSSFLSTRLAVGASGVSQVDSAPVVSGGFHSTIHADAGLVVHTSGLVYDGETFRILATLPYGGPVRPDVAARRVYALSDQGGGVRRLRAYDTDRFAEVGSLDVAGVAGTPDNLIRWGPGGLAFRTPTQVFILNSVLVPTADSANLQVTQLATPDPAVVGAPLNYFISVRNLGGGPAASVELVDTLPVAATLVGAVASQGSIDTASSPGKVAVRIGTLAAGSETTIRLQLTLPSAGTAQNVALVTSVTGDPDTANNQSTASVTVSAPGAVALKRLFVGARDLAYDANSDRLIVSAGSSAAVFPNSLLRISPADAAVSSAEFVGSNPGRVRLRADGTYAYAVLDGSSSIVRAPVVPGTSSLKSFSVGNDGWLRNYPGDILPINDRPDALVVTHSQAVLVYEDGIALPKTLSDSNYGGFLIDSANPWRIYSLSSTYNRLQRIDVLSDGLSGVSSVQGFYTSYANTRQKRAGNLVYTNSGHVIDPEAGTIVADLGIQGACEVSFYDEALYILQGSTLRSFDLVTRAPIASLNLGTLSGSLGDLVRCGGRSLAFTTSTGYLYIVDAPTVVPLPPLRVVLPARLLEGTGTVPGVGRVELLQPAAADLALQLVSSDPATLDVTRNVVIPAGQLSATFDVMVTDDAGLNGTRPVTVSPVVSAPYTLKSATTQVDDDETADLSLALPSGLTEGSGSVQAVLSLSGVAATPLKVALSSSDTTELAVPASVTIPAGAASVAFTLTLPDDDLLDGPQPVTVTATVPGYGTALANPTVADNESRQLVLNLPTTAYESSTISLEVLLSGKTVAPLVITFQNDDPSELTVPATYTIPSGQSSAYLYNIRTVNDDLLDGAQTVTVTISAPGFISGSDTISVRDDDPAFVEWGSVSGPKIAGTAFNAGFAVKTIDGLTAGTYSGSGAITAANSAGAALLKDAPRSFSISGGIGSGSVTVLTAGSQTRLIAQVAGLAAESEPFTVQSGAFARIAVAPIFSPQDDASPLVLALAAQDANGNPVASFTGSAALSVAPPPRVTGTGALSWKMPFNGQQSRTQVIYLADELGGPADWGALGISAFGTFSDVIPQFTIRIKPTALAAYTTASWDGSGWTTVYQGPLPAYSNGWYRFPFAQPFVYDGTSNLLVDFSYNAPNTYGNYVTRSTSTAATRTLYLSASGQADPLTWNGTTPTPSLSSSALNLRFESLQTIPVLPATAGPFVAGQWTGPVSFASPGANVALVATSGSSTGASNLFSVAHAAPALAEPAVSGGSSNTLAWTPRPASTATWAQASRDSAFPAGGDTLSTDWLGVPTHTFFPLAEGPWFYRVRSRASVPKTFSWVQTSQADFVTATHAGTSAQLVAGSVTLSRDQITRSENFDAPGSAWDATLFTDAAGSPGRSVLTSGQGPDNPLLPISQGGDFEAIFIAGNALLPFTAENTFADGAIEAVVAPASPTAGLVTTSLLLRAQRSNGLLARGYGADLKFSASGTATAGLSYYSNGSAYSLASGTSSFAVSAQDNFRVRFSLSGSQLTLQIWRLTVVSGAVVETPVNFASGSSTLTVTNSLYPSAGVAGLACALSNGSVQRGLFDDIAIVRTLDTYVASGSATSSLLAPASLHRWGSLTHGTTLPTGTAAAVDVLDASGAVLAADLPSGTDLGDIPAIAGQPSLRLRARLSTGNPALTPRLDDWSVSYDYAAPVVYESGWSASVVSIQDATAPSLALTSPPVSTTAAYTLAGTAFDANGVAALSVNGLPVSVSAGPAGWNRLLNLSPGANVLDLIVSDVADPANTRAVSFVVTYNPPAAPSDTDSDGLPDAWEQAHGLDPSSGATPHGRLGDPDGDGLPNLLEYAFGGDPRGADSDLVHVESALHETTGQPHLLLRHRRLISSGALTYRVLTSADLAAWAEPATPPELLSVAPHADGVTETVVWRLYPALGSGSQFVRIQVDAP